MNLTNFRITKINESLAIKCDNGEDTYLEWLNDDYELEETGSYLGINNNLKDDDLAKVRESFKSIIRKKLVIK